MARNLSGLWKVNQVADLKQGGQWVTNVPPFVEAFVVAGGGAGGAGNGTLGGGGGGGGGLRRRERVPVYAGFTYPCVVGAGGTGVASAVGVWAGFSAFANISCIGGGSGGHATTRGQGGGSTGGGAQTYTEPDSQSFCMWHQQGQEGSWSHGGGGGAGFDKDPNWAQYSPGGHAAYVESMTGTTESYSGGGGPGRATASGNGGTPASGGVGPAAGDSAPANSGSGGGGGGTTGPSPAGGNGGSGVVMIRYPDIYGYPAATTGTVLTYLYGGCRVLKWTSTGSVTF